MSTFYVNADYDRFATVDGSPYFFVDCSQVDETFFVDTSDALSDPEVEDLMPSGMALWPRGAAWGTPDGVAYADGSVLAGFSRSLLHPFADLYRRLWRLTDESRASTIVDSLVDWERDYGLPDPCLIDVPDEESRRRSLGAKVRSEGTISPEDFVRIAADLSFVIAIEEPDAFLTGESSCGSIDEISDIALEQQWVVHVFDTPVTRFEAGVGETGVTRLLDFEEGALECVLDRLSPAWTYPIYSYGGITLPFALSTELDENLITEGGRVLTVPMYFVS